jgi:hypothetical protein
MWKPTRKTKSKLPDSWNPRTAQIRESYFLWDTNCLLFDVKDSFGINGMYKAQELFDRQDDFIKIHISVRVPGVKWAYCEDKGAGCSLTYFIMSLKSKGTSKQLFHSLYQAKGKETYYSLSFIHMYDMEAR